MTTSCTYGQPESELVVWSGPARLRYHGVLPLNEGHHPLVGNCRINLSFHKAA